MPLVRIALRKGKLQSFGKKIGAVVYRTMMDVINVPAKDNFQIITEHHDDGLIYDPTYAGVQRSDGIVFIQITLSEGRTVELKKTFYKTLTERLHAELAVRTDDVFINLIEVKKENWCFGNGIALYAQ
jgi:phenylpyruvate tautomerase PptA (4-oxalocrotonate tautomerase family)